MEAGITYPGDAGLILPPGVHCIGQTSAYLAYRALNGLPWLGMDPVDNYLCLTLAHEQIFFTDGQQPSNIGFFSDSTLKSDGTPASQWHVVPGNYDDAIMRQAVSQTPTGQYSFWFSNNCQNWISNVVDRYNQILAAGKH